MQAKRSLGQNFLQDADVTARIVAALDLRSGDVVAEIGPGRGALTERLVENAERVIAIEFDREMIAPLRVQFKFNDNFELINADALSFDLSALATPGKKLKLVANLPYNISTPILQRFIEHRHLFSRLVLMFQREVAERIVAAPGGKDRGFLSVLVEDSFDTVRLFDVAPQAFRPVPKVWSAVVRLTPKQTPFPDRDAFRRVVSASFAQKRKTILNNLKLYVENAPDILAALGIDPKRRAETLTLAEWRKLAGAVLLAGNAPANVQPK